jgi:hypothetical protein
MEDYFLLLQHVQLDACPRRGYTAGGIIIYIHYFILDIVMRERKHGLLGGGGG